jgi:hypothetical protein
MLTMIIVVIGMKNLNPGLSTTMSPGSRPSGNFDSQGQARPMSAMTMPMMMSMRCMIRAVRPGAELKKLLPPGPSLQPPAKLLTNY